MTLHPVLIQQLVSRFTALVVGLEGHVSVVVPGGFVEGTAVHKDLLLGPEASRPVTATLIEEAAGEFVVDQKIGRLVPVNARNRPAHHVAAVAVGPKQKAGGSSHRPHRVSKAATASVTTTNRGQARSAANKAASVVAIQAGR